MVQSHKATTRTSNNTRDLFFYLLSGNKHVDRNFYPDKHPQDVPKQTRTSEEQDACSHQSSPWLVALATPSQEQPSTCC